MFYFILVALAAALFVMGLRANELYKVTSAEKDTATDSQIGIWYKMGGFNLLVFECGPGVFLSFLAGMGVIAAYAGLWMCALEKWAGIAVVLAGVLVCALIERSFVGHINDYFMKYKEETGEDPNEIFTGKTGLTHAVYTSVKIGVGKALTFLMLISIVGIALYFILRNMIRGALYQEERIERGESEDRLVDENGDVWKCKWHLGDDIWVYDGPNGQSIQVKASDMIHAQNNAKYISVGGHTFTKE